MQYVTFLVDQHKKAIGYLTHTRTPYTHTHTHTHTLSYTHTLTLLCTLLHMHTHSHSHSHSYSSPNVPSKYGFIEKVIDGMRVDIHSIKVNFTDPKFHARMEMADVVIQSTTPDWKPAPLNQTRYLTTLAGIISPPQPNQVPQKSER